MNNLDIALKWLDMGVGTIPCKYRSKRPLFAWDEFKTRLPTKEEIKKWYKIPLRNLAVIMGFNNLAVIDFDNLAAYDLWMQIYGQNGYADTYTVATGRGFHLYFYVEDYAAHTMKWAGGECKFSGYVLAPPSIHPSGTPYKAICPDMPIMTIGSIYDILPESVFNYQVSGGDRPCIVADFDPFNPAMPHENGSYSEINECVRVLSFFPDARRTGDGWYTVFCPIHDDQNTRHKSGWIDDNRNRFGCHACINGSLSVIDFYMRLHSCDAKTAVSDLNRYYSV